MDGPNRVVEFRCCATGLDLLYKLASWLITFARASELPRIAKVSE